MLFRSDSCPRGDIALTLYRRGYQERVVVVLFVKRKDESADNLTARYGNVVAQNGVDASRAVIQGDVCRQAKPDRFHAVADFTTHTDVTVYQFDPFSDSRRRSGGTVDGQVFQQISAGYSPVFRYIDVLN